MTAKLVRFTYYILLITLAGCSSIAPLLSTPTPDAVPTATSTPRPTPTSTATEAPQTGILRVWLPPQFDPNAGTPAADLIKQRLQDFEKEYPRIHIEIRIKAGEGDTDLIDILSATNNAAPSIMPDLIALSRSDLESAAQRGLLHPMDGLSTMLHDPNWYAYSHDLARVQNIGYGLPFAGDALVMVQRPGLDLKTWDDIISSKENFLFPAGDPQALFALSLYISAGGNVVNDQGLPTLQEESLTQVLTLLQGGVESKTFLPSLTNITSYDDSYQAYHDFHGNLAITWAANEHLVDQDNVGSIPSLNTPVTFANGWIWALAGSSPENQQLATDLAEYLMADEFLSTWVNEMGYLPTRISTVKPPDALIESILESARAIPSNDVLTTLGPIMDQAVSQVLNGEQVGDVVRSVMDQINGS